MAETLIPDNSEIECEYEYEFSNYLECGNVSCLLSIGLLDWSFVYDNPASTISLFCCVPDYRSEWSIHTRIFMEITPGDGRTPITNVQTTRFASDDPKLAFFLLDSQNAAVQTAVNDGQLKVTIKMSIIREIGLWPLVSPSADFMTKNSLSNAELLINGKQLYVNLDLLSIYSAFFANDVENMKQSRNSEEMAQITISDVDFNTMKLLLRIIYFDDICISETNVGLILFSAKKLKFETILRQCEEFLLRKAKGPNGLNPYDLPRLLQMAHDYDLSALQNFCLKSFGPRVGETSSFTPPSEVTAKEYSLPDVDVDTKISKPLLLEPHSRGVKRTYKKFIITDLLKWRILLRKSYSKLDIFISPECGEELDYAVNWCIQLSKIKVSVGEEIQTISSIQFNPSHKEHKISFLIDTTEENQTNFGVEWHIQFIKGLRFFVKDGFAYSKGITSTLKLQLDDKSIFVNLRVLAHFSSYFSNILEINIFPIDEETNLPYRNLSNIRSSQMTLLLDQVYPTNTQITGENVEELLLQADKFKFTEVVIKCVKFLETNGKFNLEVLQFAVNNKLTVLEKSCLAQFSTSMDLLEAIKKDPFRMKINREVKVLLLDKIKELA